MKNEKSMAMDFDLREMFMLLWKSRHKLVLSALFGGVLACIYAFAIVKPVYESSALLLPTDPPKDEQLGAAAALLGKKVNALGDVALYQSLLTSRQVMHKLLSSKITNGDDSAKGKIEPLYEVLMLDTAKPEEMENVINSLGKLVLVESRKSSTGMGGGIVEITVSSHAPWLAQQICERLIRIGQEELRSVQIERGKTIGERLTLANELARREWDSTAVKLTVFKDRNRSILLPDQMLTLLRLEMEKQAKEQKYLMARKELELQELELEKTAPPMMILDPANLPAKMVRPKRMMILVLGVMAGFFIAMGFVLGRNAISSFISEMK